METIKEQQEFILDIVDNTPLSKKVLKQYGFIRERKRNLELGIDGLWYNEITLHEDHWDGTFAFATMIKGDNSFKSGYNFNTLGRLKALYFGVTGRKLEKIK